jgi:hypothetical protein
MHHPDTRAQLAESATPAPAEPTPDRGWGELPCPRCLADASIRVGLDNLFEFTCTECDEVFSTADLDNLIAAWTPVLAWLRQAPVKE